MTDILIQKVAVADTDSGYTVEKEYKLSNINTLSIDLNSPVSPMPLPEEGADDNVLVKIEGNSSNMSLAWTIKDETVSPVTKKGGGVLWATSTPYTIGDTVVTSLEPAGIQYDCRVAHTSGTFSTDLAAGKWALSDNVDVLTAMQQIGYFTGSPGIGSFQPVSVTDNYRIQIKEGTDILFSKLGFFTKFTFSMSGSSPVIWNANVSFIVGNVITSFEDKVPEVPTGLGLTSGATYNGSNLNTASIDMIWDPPTITNGTLTQSVIEYRKMGETTWHRLFTTQTDPNTGGAGANAPYTLSYLTLFKYYDIRVACRTNAGAGSFTGSVTAQAT